MHTIFHKIIIILFVIFSISIVGIFIFQREKIFPAKFQSPITSGDVTQNIVANVEKTGLPLSGRPIILGDSIEASISGAHVIFNLNKDIPTQIRALQLVLGKLTIGKIAKQIDLRFNKVVISY